MPLQNLAESAGSDPVLNGDRINRYIRNLAHYLPLRTAIEEFWMEKRNRGVRTWTDHRWINEVMLASRLVPGGLLPIRTIGASP